MTVNRAETERERIQLELALARENEVEIGFKIQQILLLEPPPRDLAGIRVAALTIPSQRIDGDFYDFYRPGNRCLDVVIGDVSAYARRPLRSRSNLLERPPTDLSLRRGS